MAFDRHIEADNIEDGFITSIVRAPVVGLAWVLGGLLQDEDKENKDDLKPGGEDVQSEQHPSPMNPIQEEFEFNVTSKRHNPGIGIGNGSDDNISFESCNQSSSESSDRLTGEETPNSQSNYLQRKKTRKMSWSDESGQDLVVYCGGKSNNSPQRTTPGNIPSTTINQSKHEKHRKPMKSAIRNSRALPQQRQANKHNCIPSMGGSIVIKNGAGTVVGAVGKKSANNIIAHNAHPNAKSNGYISPQWGWYISTTPPTPEYHNTVGSHKGQVLSHTNNTSNHMQPQANSAIGRHWNPTTDTILEGTAPRPVFRKANPRPGGWPTVPI